jgi:hypothetical protein
MSRYLSSKENCEEGKAARLTTSFLGLLEDLHKSVGFISAMCASNRLLDPPLVARPHVYVPKRHSFKQAVPMALS